ncbi:MAG: hypothetical protein IJI25_08630 [Eubacterium sp.]|nr:hypothetical protein [Eubacterium sp.]
MMEHEAYDLSVTPLGDPVVIHLNRGDADFKLKFNIMSRSGTFKMENGTSAKICGTKPDGTKYEASASISGNTVTVNGDSNMTNTPGVGVFEICLTHARKELFTQNFKVCIEDI